MVAATAPVGGRQAVVGQEGRNIPDGLGGLPAEGLIQIGTDHKWADTEPLAAMLKACTE